MFRALALFFVSTLSMAAIASLPAPLNDQEKRSMGLGDPINGKNIWKIDGVRGADKAFATVFSQLGESAGGTCFTLVEDRSGDIKDGAVEWRERLPNKFWQIVWLANQRNGRPCDEMIENEPINLRTRVEENTVIQLNEQRASFVPEAVPFILSDAERALADETGHLPNPTEYLVSISPAFKNNPVLTDISIEMFKAFRTGGTYQLTLRFAQCHALSLYVRAQEDDKFEVIDASRIVC
jgi:hypothetical protein